MGEHISQGQLGGQDRILELELGEVLRDRGLIPIHLSFSNQFTNGGRSKRLCHRSKVRDSLHRHIFRMPRRKERTREKIELST